MLVVHSLVHLAPIPLVMDIRDVSGAYAIQESVSTVRSCRVMRMVHHLGQVELQSIFIVIIQVSSGELSCHSWTSL